MAEESNNDRLLFLLLSSTPIFSGGDKMCTSKAMNSVDNDEVSVSIVSLTLASSSQEHDQQQRQQTGNFYTSKIMQRRTFLIQKLRSKLRSLLVAGNIRVTMAGILLFFLAFGVIKIHESGGSRSGMISNKDSHTPARPLFMSSPDLMYICASHHIKNPQIKKKCESRCLSASCCVSSSDDSVSISNHNNCLVDNVQICLSYQACAVVHPVYGMLTREAATVAFDAVTFPELPTNNPIEEMCNPASYDTIDGRARCEQMCFVASCCFTNNHNCWNSQTLEDVNVGGMLCNIYQSCAILYRGILLHSNNSNDNDATYTSFELTTKTREMDKVCDPSKWDNLIDGQDSRESCERACLVSKCCFLSSDDDANLDDDNCRVNHSEFCDAYQACAYLYRDYQHYAIQEDLTALSTHVMREEINAVFRNEGTAYYSNNYYSANNEANTGYDATNGLREASPQLETIPSHKNQEDKSNIHVFLTNIITAFENEDDGELLSEINDHYNTYSSSADSSSDDDDQSTTIVSSWKRASDDD